MRIAVASDSSEGLEAGVSRHFGRCPHYTLIDVEGNEIQEVKSVANPYFESHEPGQVPRFIHAQEAEVIITGGMGRRAIDLFDGVGVEAVTGASGTVSDVVRDYLDGRLSGAEGCAQSARHHRGGGQSRSR